MQGHEDPPLNELGVAQAAATAERLARESIDRLLTSDLIRARLTAEAIAEPHGLVAQSDGRLRERNLGRFEGLRASEVDQVEPGALARIRGEDPTYAPPGGESVAELGARVWACLEERLFEEPVSHAVVVTHGGVLGVIVRRVLSLSENNATRFARPNACLCRFRREGRRWTLIAWGDVAHLAGLHSTSHFHE